MRSRREVFCQPKKFVESLCPLSSRLGGLYRLVLIALTFLASSCILKRMGSQLVLDAALGPFQDTALDVYLLATQRFQEHVTLFRRDAPFSDHAQNGLSILFWT